MESTEPDSGYHLGISLGIAPLWTSSDISSENTRAFTGFAVLIMEKYLEELKNQASSVMWIFGIVPLVLYGVSVIYNNRLLLISAGIMAILFAGAFAGLMCLAMNADGNYKNFNFEEPVSIIEIIKGITITETKYNITNESHIGMGIGWFLTMLVGITLIIYPLTGRYKAYSK